MNTIASGYRLGQGLAICICTLSSVAPRQWVSPGSSATDAGLRGVHDAGNGIIWASGTGGTVLRSEDDGFMWQKCALPEEARKLDFRGVWAWDANHAIVMSSGTGDASRLYDTVDGGASWRLLFSNRDPAGFWDGIAFHGKEGMLIGDPVDSRITVFRTKDLGQHWTRDKALELAANPKGEGTFAASNSSLTASSGTFRFVTGGVGGARFFVFQSILTVSGRNQIETQGWNHSWLPLAEGTGSSGAFSTDFRTPQIGIAVGGDYIQPGKSEGTAAFTTDAGAHWTASTKPPAGYRSAVAWESNFRCWIAVGPTGSDVSFDDGEDLGSIRQRELERPKLALDCWTEGANRETGRARVEGLG